MKSKCETCMRSSDGEEGRRLKIELERGRLDRGRGHDPTFLNHFWGKPSKSRRILSV